MENTTKNNAALAVLRAVLLSIAICGLLVCIAVITAEPLRKFIIAFTERAILHREISHDTWNIRLIKYAAVALIPFLVMTAVCTRPVWFLPVTEKISGVFHGVKIFFNRARLRNCLGFLFTVFVLFVVLYVVNRGVWPNSPLHNEILRAYKNNDIDIAMLPAFEMKKIPKLFLFGLENRRKLVFKNGTLSDFKTNEIIADFAGDRVNIFPQDFSVKITKNDGSSHVIIENETGVFIDDTAISGTERGISIPDFKEYRYPLMMKILYQEIMYSIIDGVPYARLFDYFHDEKGQAGGIVWYRDIAYVGLFLQAVNRTDLITDFVRNIDRMYDANRDVKEPDNLGQILFLQSLLENPNNVLVNDIIAEARRIKDADGNLIGTTDGSRSSAYQNGWLIYGLNALGLNSIAREFNQQSDIDDNGYARLLWFTLPEKIVASRRKRNVSILPTDWKGKYTNVDGQPYPYINIGKEHFNMRIRSGDWGGGGHKNPILTQVVYPITWGDGTRPHIWHDVELFMYLSELKK
jgi:hypothetical protein